MNSSALGKIWLQRELDERKVYRYVNDYGISDFVARILIARGVAENDVDNFVNPRIKSFLPDPFHLVDMERACDRVAKAILFGENITIFGDYDVDGATSSALIARLLGQLGASASIYIPDRLTEGYGPSIESFLKIKNSGSSLVITVDCGISAFEALEGAKLMGLDVIVLDHHVGSEIMPEAFAIVNPNRFDETSSYNYLAAVGVSFLFAVGLIKILRQKNFFASYPEPDLLKFLDLVALGTVCDMMPLIGLNRAFVAQGLKVMSSGSNLGLKILSEYGKIDEKFSSYHLGFVLGPRINAGGRVGKSYLGARLLATSNEEVARKYAIELEQYNEERKKIENMVTEDAYEQAETQKDNNYILVANENWHQGVIGIVAGKLKDKYQKPVIAISLDGEAGRASCRSVKGIDLGQKIVTAKSLGILLSGGGHAMAAGFSIEKDKIPRFREFLDENLKNDFLHGDPNLRYFDAHLTPGAVSLNYAKEIAKLEPYGNGNNEPIVKIDGLYVLRANISNDKHISCLFAPQKEAFGSKAIKAIAFNSLSSPISDILLSMKPHRISAIGHLKVNNWQGNAGVQVTLSDLIVER
ncbi:MAG: single-stranded-DNA-specific exonuclease RecJ [Rickettsiaceae bacterium]|nr:single-stranded-DNA-specific exonuclease RecJ [Rickettsiaceae bacterium]